jgi:hypothetical protein
MVTKYYVAIRPQTDDRHNVHKEDCPFLPEAERRIFLGIFQSPQDAVAEGTKYFNRSNNCLFCSKEHQHQDNKPLISELLAQENYISSDSFTAVWDSALRCSVN